MRIPLRVGLVPLLVALALAGCSAAGSTNTQSQGTAGPANVAQTSTAPASAAASGAGGDTCRYLSVDEVRHELAYDDTITATEDDTTADDPRCQYTSPGAVGLIGAITTVTKGRKYFDDEKSLNVASDCVSAAVGDESLYCPKSQQGWVVFVANGSSVSISVTNIQSLLGPKGTDSTQAALALAKLVAGRV